MKEKSELKVLNRLEAALKSWEQRLLLAHSFCVVPDGRYRGDIMESLSGSVIYWPTFRECILHHQPITLPQFFTPAPVIEHHFQKSLVFQWLPFFMDAWSKTRRVYTLTGDLQRSLELARFGNVSLRDIHPPFPSFCVTLPIPIEWEIGDVKGVIDFLLVNFDEEGVQFVGLGPDTDDISFLGRDKQFRLLKAVKKGEKSLVKTLRREYPCLPQNQMLTLPWSTEPISKALAGDDFDGVLVNSQDYQTENYNKLPKHWQFIAKLVFSLCLHLEMQAHRPSKKPVIRQEALTRSPAASPHLHERLITDEASICAIGLTEDLCPEEIAAHEHMRKYGVRPSGYHLGYQIRGQHWRRPVGAGHDDNAPRTIFVGTYKVHPELEPKNGVPVGVEVNVR